ncbi:MAG TPA: hypothetical protein VLL76_05830, partial [Candidatus Omnitrophota bacterium]|nr:hypothetical protein [Candidatus Omnitrophota bacterium]
ARTALTSTGGKHNRITEADITNAFDRPGLTPAESDTAKRLLLDKAKTNLAAGGHAATDDSANALFRSIGKTPLGENPLQAAVKRHFYPNRGVPGAAGRATGLNRRLLGGGAGAATGFFSPELADIATNIARSLGDQAVTDVMPAN